MRQPKSKLNKSKLNKPELKNRPGFSEDGVAFGAAPDRVSTHQVVELGAGGRLVIPAPMRAGLGMKVGDRLTVRLEGNQVSVYTYEEGIRRAQEMISGYLPDNAVDEFLRWKRAEAAKEEAELEGWSRNE